MKLVTVNVYAYVNPIKINPVNINAPWYKERAIVYSCYHNVTALEDGYKVNYSIMVYKFRKVVYSDEQLNKLIEMIRANVNKSYHGWIHHANVYEKIPGKPSGKFLKQIILNFDL